MSPINNTVEPEHYLNSIYKPDVLQCLANLSNDEVFTPPDVVNAMLNLLPQSLWSDSKIRFLDPVCKSGVFLREIAKRLIDGLESEIPDLQKRLDHIFHNQIFGIAITELTSLVSRRTVYCSKNANSKYTVSSFDNKDGNVFYSKRTKHQWENGRCIYCGANQETYDRPDSLESYAYQFIHPGKVFKNMKFDVIVGNPPYQLSTGESGKQATPLYHLFVNKAQKLNPRYVTMIIPARWYAGGMGLDVFRDKMINDKHITHLVDYVNAKDCFPQNSISGGVCYFLWERDKEQECQFTSIHNEQNKTMTRWLNEFPVLVRYNEAVEILHKVLCQNEEKFETIVSPLMPYGLSTNIRGNESRTHKDDLILHASDGISYYSREQIRKGQDTIDCYKILISKTGAEHAGEPGKDGMYRVLTSSLKVIGKGEICTHSYFVIGKYSNKTEAENTLSYLKTRFVRFLILMAMTSINLSKLVFCFVPLQDFSKPWTDEELYTKYGLSEEEIAFIESMIRPME